MQQFAGLLETFGLNVSRVGTGYEADLSSRFFVCVQNSAWKLSNLSFDVLILDEAHHWEPVAERERPVGKFAVAVLAMSAQKRFFFSASLRNQPNFSFGTRRAIEAKVITDYQLLAPIVSEGDVHLCLVRLLQGLPTARRILAFCNTIMECKTFVRLLKEHGMAADHYNANTRRSQRESILDRFRYGRAEDGIRVLVTVNVLSEGVDIPCADTCLFVEPRHGTRLQQCVGRVLRKEASKCNALIITPPLVMWP